jgi:hypothetical protein
LPPDAVRVEAHLTGSDSGPSAGRCGIWSSATAYADVITFYDGMTEQGRFKTRADGQPGPTSTVFAMDDTLGLSPRVSVVVSPAGAGSIIEVTIADGSADPSQRPASSATPCALAN